MAIDGTWNLTFETPIGAQELTLEAKASDGVLTGTQSSPDGSQPIQDGVVNGDEASWSVTISSPMPMTLEFKGTLDGDNMSGSAKLGMFGEARFTGVRATNAASDDPARTTLALNPIIGLRGSDLIGAAEVAVRALVTQPTVAAKSWMNFVGSLANIVTGKADEKPDPRDKRFADPTWGNSEVHAALWQAYAALGSAVNDFVERADLSDADRQRARLAGSILIDALAPSNMLLVNPTALRQIVDTGGESLIRGASNFVNDLVNNGGLPASVDKSKFQVGKNLATAEGACVLRSEIAELLQFKPQSAEVYSRPLVIVPPQINKYYALDLSPDKSLIQYLAQNVPGVLHQLAQSDAGPTGLGPRQLCRGGRRSGQRSARGDRLHRCEYSRNLLRRHHRDILHRISRGQGRKEGQRPRSRRLRA